MPSMRPYRRAVVVAAALAAADLLAVAVVPRAAAPRVVARPAVMHRLLTMTASPARPLQHLQPLVPRLPRRLRRAAVRPLPAVPVAVRVARQPARVAAVPRPHARIRRSS